ncbi:MAG: hypothetical protein IT383_11535 [Deltaproteobacteria bacterium]|nr:hypothetical protein [Deltaproteobacteria bacterium]
MTTKLVAIAGALLFATGCPPPANFLDGSVKESHDLAFDTVEVRFFPDQETFQVAYFKQLAEDGSTGVDTVAKLVFAQPEGGVVVEEVITLDPAVDVMQRITAADDPFPDLREGQVSFTAAATVGATTAGEFSTTFTNGKTLNGAFEGELLSCSFDSDDVCGGEG